MQLDEVIRARSMVRRYTDEPVEPAVVDRALNRAVRAPSAGFTQGWAFLVLDTPVHVAAFWAAATPPGRGTDAWSIGMRRAPVVVVPLSSRQAYLDRYAEPDKGWIQDESRWPVPYWHVDAGMAALLMMLSVVDDGLGACFFGVPSDRVPVLREAFGVPADYSPVGALTIGHRDESAGKPAARRRRRPMREVVHRGRWGA